MRVSRASGDGAMLEARILHKSFNGFAAVGGVSLTVPERGITAVIGPNGAGKSTLFNLATGHLRADAGQARNFWGRAETLYRERAWQILGSLGLTAQADAIGDSLSHGNQKQLELGIALASDPKLLLLDEPTAGMSAAETRDAIRLLERIVAERELTLLFTEHDMDVVFSIAQKIAVLHQGRLIAEGTPAQVRADADVRRVYLGGRS